MRIRGIIYWYLFEFTCGETNWGFKTRWIAEYSKENKFNKIMVDALRTTQYKVRRKMHPFDGTYGAIPSVRAKAHASKD